MAEDQAQRTEEPTPRRRLKAREEGQVPSSKELTSSLQFAAAILMLTVFGATAYQGVAGATVGLVRMAFRADGFTVGMLQAATFEMLGGPMLFFWIFAGTLLAVGLISHMAQTSFAIAPKRLAPDFKRLNPLQKLKDLPGENLAQTAKSLLLLPLAGLVFYWVIRGELDVYLALPLLAPGAGAATVGESLLGLLQKASVVLLALGLFDLWRQRRKLGKKLKMTKQEVRQEHKDTEGDPHLKARLRRMQRELVRKRMLQDVPDASLVVTNPTHYAVALKYEPDHNPAPVVVAKGLDFLALKIRGIAEEHGVPIVENPPLAQALYQGSEVGGEIPIELYRAVAEILAYIYRLKGRRPPD